MIIGVLFRHYKNYSYQRFVPIANASGMPFSVFVGNNGVGKSAVLESLDVYFNSREWNISSGIKRSEAYICPIFLIEKSSVPSNKKASLEIVSNYLWDQSLDSNPSFNGAEIQKFFKFRNEFRRYQRTHYLILIGFTFDSPKDAYFATFDNTIYSSTDLEQEEAKEINKFLQQNYNYIYLPVEESAHDILRIHDATMQKLLNKDILKEIEKILTRKNDKNQTIVKQINDNLNSFIDEVNDVISVIDDRYRFAGDSGGSKKNLTAKDIREKILEAYFPLRNLKVDGLRIDQLSSGEQRKAIMDIAYSIIAANGERKVEKETILAIDEPEASMHVSNCFKHFQMLYELASDKKIQIMITSHWYGFIPSTQDGALLHIEIQGSHSVINRFDLSRILEEKRRFPNDIELKSHFDLASSIIAFMRNTPNTNWIICEGSDDKVYLETMLEQEDCAMILPVGGCGNVIKLFQIISVPLSEKDEAKAISGKVLFIIDTDEHQVVPKQPVGLSSINDNTFLRRLQKKEGAIKLVDPYVSDLYSKTEIEDCLNPTLYFEAIKNVINKTKKVKLKALVDEFEIKEDASYSSISGEDTFLNPKTLEAYKNRKLLIDFVEDKNNKYLIAEEYASLKPEKKPTYSLADEIKRIIGDNDE